MDRLSALDTSFLHLERPSTHMHIASLGIYEGPVPHHAELRATLERRLHLVPRFRQRLASVPLNQHRPVWVDDDRFELDRHLKHLELGQERDDCELSHLVGRLLSEPLDRSRPLWEMWLVDGLRDGRFALLSKTHHALWDGVAGADLHSILLDTSAEASDPEPTGWRPSRPPSALGMLTEGVRDRISEPLRTGRGVARALRAPDELLRGASDLLRGGLAYTRASIQPAPSSPLNVPISGRRRFGFVERPLGEVRRVGRSLGGTVNDVVLASVAGALRRWLIHRCISPYDLRVMVPVSVRRPADRGTLGNRVAMIIVTLPVSEPHPVRRLQRVSVATEREKRSGQVRASEVVTQLAGISPPQVLAGLTRFQSLARWFNLLVTNIPGPQFPLYLHGRRLVQLFPQAPLPARQALNVAAMSYDGKMGFGVLADRDAILDLDVFTEGLEASVDELVDRAGPPETAESLEDLRLPVTVGP